MRWTCLVVKLGDGLALRANIAGTGTHEKRSHATAPVARPSCLLLLLSLEVKNQAEFAGYSIGT